MSTPVKATPVSIEEFAAALRKLPASAFHSTNQVYELMCSAPVHPDSLAPYLHWDRQHYTRNLVDKTPLYELIAICWEVGQFSSVHNHQGQNCWMAVPFGRLLVQNYRTVSEEFALTRPAFRWRQLVALARVTASEFGQPAAGYADACKLLRL